MLGVGLHTYGFMESAVFWIGAYIASQLALIAAASLPVSMWCSTGKDPAPSTLSDKRPSAGGPGTGRPGTQPAGQN